MRILSDLVGTLLSYFRIGDVLIKYEDGMVSVRNKEDTQDIPFQPVISSKFAPNTVVTDDTDGLVLASPSGYFLTITPNMGNLIALSANPTPYDDITIDIGSGWASTDVGTFRLDIVIGIGQTITFDGSIQGIADLDLAPDTAVSLLFDKPYGISTWYVRQSI